MEKDRLNDGDKRSLFHYRATKWIRDMTGLHWGRLGSVSINGSIIISQSSVSWLQDSKSRVRYKDSRLVAPVPHPHSVLC